MTNISDHDFNLFVKVIVALQQAYGPVLDQASGLETVHVVVTLSELSPTNVSNTLDRLRDMGVVNKNRVDYDKVVLLCSSSGRSLPSMRGTISSNKVQEIIKESKSKYKEFISGPKGGFSFANPKRKQENDG